MFSISISTTSPTHRVADFGACLICSMGCKEHRGNQRYFIDRNLNIKVLDGSVKKIIMSSNRDKKTKEFACLSVLTAVP